MKLSLTRAMVKAILSGTLKNIETKKDPIFGLAIPVSCPDVPQEVLQPQNTWKDAEAYRLKAIKLAQMFDQNFNEIGKDAPEEVKQAGPVMG